MSKKDIFRIRPQWLFLESVARDFKRTGAVAPSSRSLASALTRELAWYHSSGSQCSVLEVGAGTGSVTERIVRHISLGDCLDVYEIDRKFIRLIKKRLREDKSFHDVMAEIRVFHRPIEKIARQPRYDFIISCLPFTNFEPEAVRNIFEIFRSILNPGGRCSFFEYIFLRRAARIISGNSIERARVDGVGRIVRDYIRRYGYSHEVVLRNLPPAIVHHVRFN